jgi:hypothetical protein
MVNEAHSNEAPRIELNDLLGKHAIDPEKVLVLRHRPPERELRKVLPWLAAEKHDLFNAYEQTQTEKVEKAMTGCAYVASFIGHQPGRAVFIGLYSIRGSKPLTFEQFWQVPASIELKKFGMKGLTEDSGHSPVHSLTGDRAGAKLGDTIAFVCLGNRYECRVEIWARHGEFVLGNRQPLLC